ncbi:hypothetical protein [Microvirga massiliensis]|uniref:hypothetical protein n=1 Tax=Microvirga massiliensis TaxID=1033741 RepID=UPI0011C705F6|nr:hypothetical protein [Microvirga massiliensis]
MATGIAEILRPKVETIRSKSEAKPAEAKQSPLLSAIHDEDQPMGESVKRLLEAMETLPRLERELASLLEMVAGSPERHEVIHVGIPQHGELPVNVPVMELIRAKRNEIAALMSRVDDHHRELCAAADRLYIFDPNAPARAGRRNG